MKEIRGLNVLKIYFIKSIHWYLQECVFIYTISGGITFSQLYYNRFFKRSQCLIYALQLNGRNGEPSTLYFSITNCIYKNNIPKAYLNTSRSLVSILIITIVYSIALKEIKLFIFNII